MRTKGERDWNSTQAKLRGGSSEIPRNKSYHLHSLLHGTVPCIQAWGTVMAMCPSQLKEDPKEEGSLRCWAAPGGMRPPGEGRSDLSFLCSWNLALNHTGSLHVVEFDNRRYLMESLASPPQKPARNTGVTVKILPTSKISHSGL